MNRCKDNETNPFNSKSSDGLQELVAEIGAAFLNNHTAILNDNNMKDSAAYIQGWIQQLRNDKKFIIEASAKAQRSVDYKRVDLPFFMRITLFNLELPWIKTHTQAPLMLSFPKLEHTFLSPHNKAQIFTFN